MTSEGVWVAHFNSQGTFGMKFALKSLVAPAVLCALAFSAAPANAAVLICTGANCVSTDGNVLVNKGTGSTVTGSVGGVGLTFTSSTDSTLVGGANGQARVESGDGLLNALTFTIQSGYGFESAIFNLSPVPGRARNEATSVFLTYLLSDGTTASITKSVATNGNNWFGIYGDAGEVFTSAGFIANPSTTGIHDMRQVRLGGVSQLAAAVPEPATWALMLLGFGLIGGAMRSRRKDANVRVSFG